MLAGEKVSEQELKCFLLAVQEAFLALDFDVLRSKFLLPLVVYSAAGVLLIKDKAGFRDHAGRYLDALLANGVRMSDCQIVEIDALNNRRFRSTVRWTDFRSSGEPVSRSLIRYFMIEDTADVWKIEMMEYVELPISISEAERIIH